MSLVTYESLPANNARPQYRAREITNAVKAFLIDHFCMPGSHVLDLCCGRGGDLLKFRHAGVTHYRGMDASENSIRLALERAEKMRDQLQSMDIRFSVFDLSKWFTVGESFSQVTCFFGIHYFGESAAKLNQFFSNVTKHLKRTPVSCFICTTVDDRVLGDGFEAGYAKAVFAPGTDRSPPLGVPYTFYYEGSVDGEVEYVMKRETLESYAKIWGLEIQYEENLYTFYRKFVRQVTGPVSEDDVRVAALYRVFVFVWSEKSE
jgi:mRNA (guanine-N7-)-methyltransferase